MKLSIVESWHRSLAAGDIEGLVDTTAPDVHLGGPRGGARGHEALRQWATHAGVSLEPVRWFCGKHGEVVVVQHASWADQRGGRTSPVIVATRFVVSGGLIRQIDRHDELETALAAAGLRSSDEAMAGGPR